MAVTDSGAPIADMEPFFFGPDDTRLFGCYHPPATPVRACGIVLAYPLGHEYLKFHRAYRQLALLLADAGFPVLRFDYRGCGDSAGDHDDWSLDHWRADLAAAVAELQRKSGAPTVGLIGMQISAALAMQAGAAGLDVDSLVLWDPVLNGEKHLERLAELHRGMLAYAHVLPEPGSDPNAENLGYPMPPKLRSDLAELRLLLTRRKPARRVLLLESNPDVDQEPLQELLVRLVVNPAVERFPNPRLWTWTEDFGRVHVPHKIIQAIVSWLSGEYE